MVDAKGIVVARGHNPTKFGDDKSKTELFGRALEKKASQVGIEFSTSTGKLSVDAVYPILKDGELLGLIKVGTYPEKTALMHLKKMIDAEIAVIDEKNKKVVGATDDALLSMYGNLTNELSEVDIKGKSFYVKKIPLLFNGQRVENVSIATLMDIASISELNKKVFLSLVLGSVFILALLIVIIIVILNKLLSPLGKLADLSQDLSVGDGDLTKRLSLDGEANKEDGSEINKATHFMNIFLQNMHDAISKAKSVSTQNAALAVSLNSIAHEIENISHKEKEFVTDAGNSSKNSQKLLEETKIEFAKLENDIENTDAMLDDAMREILSMIESVRENADSENELASRLSQLSSDAEQAKGILSVISDIAEQTNLLALNAAIEAARAGEHGRGFAVVADEVRKLAERTQKSLTEINSTIGVIVQSISDASEQMNAGASSMESLVEQSKKAEEKITASNKNMQSAKAIAKASLAQIDSVVKESSKVVANMEKIIEISKEKMTKIEEIASASTDLDRLTKDMNEHLMQFKTN
jgi:methyl-accepting chemotaxis protein